MNEIERATYAGLTISDKPALEDAKADGKKILTMAFSDRVQVVDIDIALSQIAELESALPDHAPCHERPLTWNERINQMTVEEKAKWFDAHMDWCPFDECAENQNCEKCYAKFLASPYTEGETK